MPLSTQAENRQGQGSRLRGGLERIDTDDAIDENRRKSGTPARAVQR